MLDYAPRTDFGTGFLVPLAKTMVRPLYMLGAVSNEWPMTLEQAQAEIADALNRWGAIEDTSFEILSTQANDAIGTWRTQLAALQARINDRITETSLDQALDAEIAPNIVEFSRQTWALLSLLDTELMGLNDDQTDPGRQP